MRVGVGVRFRVEVRVELMCLYSSITVLFAMSYRKRSMALTWSFLKVSWLLSMLKFVRCVIF